MRYAETDIASEIFSRGRKGGRLPSMHVAHQSRESDQNRHGSCLHKKGEIILLPLREKVLFFVLMDEVVRVVAPIIRHFWAIRSTSLTFLTPCGKELQ
jgi:hypothetical protein